MPAPWLCVVLAIASFFLLHSWAEMPSAAHLGDVVGRSILIAVSRLLQYVFPGILLLLAAIGAVRSLAPSRRWRDAPLAAASPDPESETQPSQPDISRWSVELLRALEWKRFEEICAAYFETLGFRCKVSGPGADGGVDIHLFTGDEIRPSIIAQCKSWNVRQVGVKPIRELFGVMAAEGIAEGTFVTTGTYTDDAKEFAQGKNLALIDGPDLLEKITSASVENQERLLKLATSGDFITPTCPSCGVKMVKRAAKMSEDTFWGCSRFPACRSTLRIRTAQ